MSHVIPRDNAAEITPISIPSTRNGPLINQLVAPTYETTMISQQERKELLKHVKSFIITSGEGETGEVAIDIVDYDIMEQYGGKFDETAVKHVMNFLPDFVNKKKNSGNLPEAETDILLESNVATASETEAGL